MSDAEYRTEQAIAATLGGGDSSADDALALLDEIREAGRISYDDYSLLFDSIAILGCGTCEQVLKENAKLREQIDTLVCAVESEGIKYHVDKDGNQHFDYGKVKDYRTEQIAEEAAKRLSENWKSIPANPSGFGMKLTDEEIEEVLGSEER